MSFLQFLIYMTSINFWRLPDYSWRRTLDLIVVKSCVLYHNYLAWSAEYVVIYYSIFAIGTLFYPLGHYMFDRGYKWLSVYSHMSLHTVAALGCMYLYTGAIPRANSLLM